MDFDALIVGSGAGGGTLAYKLAKSGKSVLIIEKGQGTLAAEIGQDEGSMLIQRLVHDDRQLYVNGRVDRLFTGSIAGGGTSLYGAVLLRPSREDFHPGKYYLQRIDQSIWDWTVGYDELKSYYDEAENLYLVAGDSPTETPYLEKRDLPYLGKLPHLEPINQTFQKGLSRQGVNAFRLPLAIDFETCFRCPSCPGYGCPNNSRSSSMNRCIEPAITQFNAKLLTNHEVTKLNSNTSGKVSSISIRDRKSMKLKEFTARHYIVSAGAVGSPALMLRSGIQDKSGQLGRNFMYHAGAIVAGIFTHATGAADRFVKQLGWSDDYLGVRDFKHKLGYVQMLPVPGPLTLQSESPIPIPPNFAKKLHAHSVTFAACVEDLPREDNRIQVHSGGKLTLHHSFSS
ncbi:GMC family oxidoreductase, partial [bacterium]|nr:GMC family oxidoreductase [bacterium]